MRALVIGGGAREHAIAAALQSSNATILSVGPGPHPGLDPIAAAHLYADPTVPGPIVEFAQRERAEYAVIGPEAPLASGVSDALRAAGVPVVGPSKAAAQIETSKQFCRELLARHAIDASPRYLAATHIDEVDARVAEFHEPFVVKPIGLSAGKGVWVQGRDFQQQAEAATYAKRLLASGGPGVIFEERLDGEEFSLMAFVTDSGIYPMPAVQDYKRALEGDQGANTGGMGSYSQRDHLLPFLSREHADQAVEILEKTVRGLAADGFAYRGVLYGGFMLTGDGPKVLEFNARFGDPEAINVLALYEPGDFDALLYGVATGRIDPNLVTFRLRATVVKYVVPTGYGSEPVPGADIELDVPAIEAAGVRIRYGSVQSVGPTRVRLGRSRGIALVGEASAVHEASTRVNAALSYVRGEYYVRKDIGTASDLVQRVEHVRRLFVPGAKPSPIPLSVAPPDAPPSSAAPPELLEGG